MTEDAGHTTSPIARVWTLIGKAGAILGLVLAGNAVRGVVWPNSPQLEAQCRYESSPASAALLLRHSGGLKIFRDRALRALGYSSQEAPEPKIEEFIKTLYGELTDAPSPMQQGFPSFLTCVVSNTGTRAVKDVKFVLPVPVRAVTDSSSGKPWQDVDSSNVLLGDLAPNTHVVVWMLTEYWDDWSRRTSPTIDGTIALSHSDGSGKVSMAVSVSTLTSYLGLGWSVYPWNTVLLVGSGALLGLVARSLVRGLQRDWRDARKRTHSSQGQGDAH